MAIPDFQSTMKPILLTLKKIGECHLNTMVEELAKYFGLSDEQRAERLNSGQPRFDNRIGWARTYLYKAGLIEYPKKAHLKITQRGLDVLKSEPKVINTHYLSQFDEFVEFKKKHKLKKDKKIDDVLGIETPEETLEKSYNAIRENLARELLEMVVRLTPAQFEKLVVELLVKMGYGGSIQDAGQAIGRSGDEGIDGVIKEDKLGLDKIYIQAKKWDPKKTVAGSEVQAFAGALLGKRATKGVFITTASFSKAALEFNPANVTVIRIDGTTLAQYMIDHNLGVTTITSYDIKRIDSDYFDMN